KVANEQGVVIGAGRSQEELPQERMVRIAELAKLEDRGYPEDVAEDRHSGEREQPRAETAHERAREELRDAERIGGAIHQDEREDDSDRAGRDRDRAHR